MIRHGSPAGYQAGCRDQCCAMAKFRESKLRRQAIARGHTYQVPCDRSRRKVRALMALGWPASEIGHRIGVSQQAISRILARDTIRATTAAWIDEVYTSLEMKIPEDTIYTRRTKNAARKAGWPPPLAYDDIDAGILADQGQPERSAVPPDRLDEVEIERLFSGDWGRRLSRREKTEAMRRWIAGGRSEASLCLLTGWGTGRYHRVTHQEES